MSVTSGDGPGSAPRVGSVPARDAVFGGAPASRDAAASVLDEFLAETSIPRALDLWFGDGRASRDGRARALRVESDVARIDEILRVQLDAVLHHPRFQRIEASWRGLRYLTERLEAHRGGDGPPVKIRVLACSWAEAARDLERAIDFDQSQLFKKIHDDGFGAAGGEPFGLILGDYDLAHKPRPGHPQGDVGALAAMSHVAAASFAPFVAGCHASFFGIDRFAELALPLDLQQTFATPEYARWTAFRKSDDARFVALTVPRVLARRPWRDDGTRADGFRYHEDASNPDGSGLLWGTAVYAFGSVVVRAFAEWSWPAEIRGLGEEGVRKGVVDGLVVDDFETDRAGVAPKIPTDVAVTDRLEHELGDLGFVPLCALEGSRLAAFFATPSVQLPPQFDKRSATNNAKLSTMVQYMLCVSRFAHFVKAMGRDKVGSYSTAAECKRQLEDWLAKYTTGDDDSSPATRARYPLRDAQVEVREQPGKAGAYFCVVHLRPHYQLDQVAAAVRLVTEFAPVRAD
jgi:type VI secretion system protein ImpD